MSILIKGMEMPKNCYDCIFWSGYLECTLTGMDSSSREQFCPLVPIPPHGRLIDADKAAKKVWELMRFPSNLANAQWIENTLREMPTIIEAEEEEE